MKTAITDFWITSKFYWTGTFADRESGNNETQVYISLCFSWYFTILAFQLPHWPLLKLSSLVICLLLKLYYVWRVLELSPWSYSLFFYWCLHFILCLCGWSQTVVQLPPLSCWHRFSSPANTPLQHFSFSFSTCYLVSTLMFNRHVRRMSKSKHLLSPADLFFCQLPTSVNGTPIHSVAQDKI